MSKTDSRDGSKHLLRIIHSNPLALSSSPHRDISSHHLKAMSSIRLRIPMLSPPQVMGWAPLRKNLQR
ncbi:MAG: hypothetical protein QCI38_01630 [Candidatus Thermoplasmatota archaeon]|nr:hypothetical protein [Candidatus Thermoplasmatota archaeon]